MNGKRRPNSAFKGIVLERKVKNLLNSQGYLAIRSPRSLGLFDVWAVNKAHIRLIQIKYNVISQKEVERIRAFDNLPDNASKEVWVYKKGEFEIMAITTSPFNDLVGLFLKYCRDVLKEKCADRHQSILYKFRDYAGQQGIDPLKIAKDEVRQYLAELYEKDFDAEYRGGITSSLQKFYDFMVKYNIIKDNIFNAIKLPKIHQGLPEILTEEEMTKLLDSVPDPLQSAILETLYATGMTSGELCGVNYKDIDFQKEIIKIYDFMGDERKIPITKNALTKIKNYRNFVGNPSIEALFLNSQSRRMSQETLKDTIALCGKDSGLNRNINARLIRASLIVHLLDRGMDPISVKNLMGLADVKSLTPYFPLMMKDKRETIENFHPRETTNDITPEDIINSQAIRAEAYERESFIPHKIQMKMRYKR